MDLLLHSLHASWGAHFEKAFGQEFVASYDDVDKEYQAACHSVGLLDASFRGLLQVVGPDRLTFLQGMCTQDLRGLLPGQSLYAAFLTAKGAMVSDARIFATSDALWLDVEPGQSQPLTQFLSQFLISEDAELRDVSSEWAMLSLLGPKAGSLEKSPEGLWLPSMLPEVPGVDVWFKRQELTTAFQAMCQQADVTPIGLTAREILRVEQGIPRFGMDMGSQTIPLEARLERAISYDKGCYIGQEVVARATFRGHMNKLLSGFLLGPQALPYDTELFAADKKVGVVKSVVFSPRRQQFVALGYVHRDFVTPGTLLLTPQKEKVHVTSLPF